MSAKSEIPLSEREIRFAANQRRIRFGLVIVLIQLIALVDLFMVDEGLNGIPYIAPVILTLIVGNQRLTYGAAIAGSVLTWLVPMLQPSELTPFEIGQRSMGTCAIWVTAFVTVLRKEIEARIDLLVDERTDALEKAKADLEQELENRKAAEEANYRLESQLIQVRKNESIGVMAKGIAHNFNNLLQPIISLSDMAQEDVEPGSQLKTDLQMISDTALKARNLVNQISGFGGDGDQSAQDLDLGTGVVRALGIMRTGYPNLELPLIDTAHGLPLVHMQPKHLDQIVSILFDNSRRALEGSRGAILVKVDKVELPDDHNIFPQNMRGGEYVRLTFSDEGCGMEAEVLDRAFEPFFTTRDVNEGMGLGLTVLKGLVLKYKGGLHVESHAGEGTTFQLFFRPSSFRDDTRVLEIKPIPAAAGKSVMLVDDDPQCVLSVTRMLGIMGMKVSPFSSGKEAIKEVKGDPGAFDLVIADENMPEVSGLQVATEVHAVRPGVPVIILTGMRGKTYLGNLVMDDGGSVLHKPISHRELEKAVRRVFSDPVSRT